MKKYQRFINKVGQRRQLVLPKELCDKLGIEEGKFVELRLIKGTLVLTPLPF